MEKKENFIEIQEKDISNQRNENVITYREKDHKLDDFYSSYDEFSVTEKEGKRYDKFKDGLNDDEQHPDITSATTSCCPGMCPQSECNKCAAGRFENSTECEACQAGMFSSSGKASCRVCDDGSEVNLGQTGCNACTPGEISIGGAACSA